MGKIVRAARIVDERYYVDVPPAGLEEPPSAPNDRAQEYAAAFRAPGDAFGNFAPDVAEPAPVQTVDWEALRADAETIVDRAASDAETLLSQAESAALDLVAKADARVNEIEEEARARGSERGYEEGKQRGQAELDPVIASFRDVAQSIREQRQNILERAEPELVRLAMTIAERIVHTEVVTNANVVVENVRSALTRIISREVVTLRVNPADHDIIRAHRDAIHAASDVEHLRIVEDQRVDRGGVVIETEAGTIDAKIATQLMEARRAILNEEAIALGPSLDEQEMLQSSPAAS
ncbi:MAG TPA: FliH/SctL family protein [Candidatus Baltobacteraceae bacterium]|nr:FliH/SctL family protein [Candidatus Baltobacteraceae bacterium]